MEQNLSAALTAEIGVGESAETHLLGTQATTWLGSLKDNREHGRQRKLSVALAVAGLLGVMALLAMVAVHHAVR